MRYQELNTKQRVVMVLLTLADLYVLASALWIEIKTDDNSGMALVALLVLIGACVASAILLHLWFGKKKP